MKVKWQSDAPNMELKVPSEVKIDGYIPTEQDLMFTGDQANKLFSHGKFSWVLENYMSLLSFSNITNAIECFSYCESDVDLTNLTFYISNSQGSSISEMFRVSNLPHLPHIVGLINSCSTIFYHCYNKSIPDNFFDDCTFKKTNQISCSSMFDGCSNLTKVPSLKAFKQLQSTRVPSLYSNFYYYLFNGCHSLQEIRDLPIVYGINSEVKQNFFQSTLYYTRNLSSFTFEPNQTVRFSNQILDFTNGTGYDTGYPQSQNIKNSVYNYNSAVETINSLPDTSAYLEEKGGTNTIKFYSDQGANTEGGAIGNLTAEEIAVAAAKGWTVAFR